VDRLLAAVVVGLAAVAAYLLAGDEHAGAAVAVLVAAVLLVGLGFTALLGLRGTSPGKALLGLRVVHEGTGTPIGLGRAALRTLVLAAATVPTFGLAVATLAWTALMDRGRQRRGWHDHLASSIVVDVRPVAAPVEPVEVEPRHVVNLTAMRLLPAPDGAVAPATRWRVTFDTGETLLVEGPALLGRRPEPRSGELVRHVVPLRSDDMSLSKTHAELRPAPDGGLVLTDRGSRNGSVLVRRGVTEALPAGRPAALLDGDRVCLGDRQMVVAREP
jgi:uncharacterized RDD family membrane protein YckC